MFGRTGTGAPREPCQEFLHRRRSRRQPGHLGGWRDEPHPVCQLAYVGLERIEGTLHGRTGTFVLLHSATGSQGEQHGSWTIVPGSGGGELAGIRGSGEITDQHDFVLEYALDA